MRATGLCRRCRAPDSALALMLAACGGGAPVQDSAASTDTSALVTYPADAPAAWDRGRLPPPGALVREGACPFECCQYGEWWADSGLAVHPAAGQAADTAFVLPPRARFTAETGVLYVRSMARVVIEDTVGPGEGDLPVGLVLTPADTLYLLQPIGEGWFDVWLDGRELELVGFWEPWYRSRQPIPARLEGEYAREWWVRVRAADGRTGWIWMDRLPSAPWGADGCGPPPPAGD